MSTKTKRHIAKRKRPHEGSYADGPTSTGIGAVLQVIGGRPENAPYLSIRRPGPDGEFIASIDNANALRGLAKAILRSLGDID